MLHYFCPEGKRMKTRFHTCAQAIAMAGDIILSGCPSSRHFLMNATISGTPPGDFFKFGSNVCLDEGHRHINGWRDCLSEAAIPHARTCVLHSFLVWVTWHSRKSANSVVSRHPLKQLMLLFFIFGGLSPSSPSALLSISPADHYQGCWACFPAVVANSTKVNNSESSPESSEGGCTIKGGLALNLRARERKMARLWTSRGNFHLPFFHIKRLSGCICWRLCEFF